MATSRMRHVSLVPIGMLVAIVPSALQGCTFAGLGNYDVETCARPTGVSTTVQKVGAVNDLTFASASGKNVIGAFAADVTGGSCIEAVGATGFLNPNCSFLTDETSLVPRQPMVVPMSGGYAAALVATTAPCTAGALIYRFNAPNIAGKGNTKCEATGAALPSVAALPDGATAVVAWYATSFDSRRDPISSCAGAKAASLEVAVVTGAATGSPVLGAAITLSPSSTSLRPPAIILLGAQAIVAAPDANDVGVWAIDAGVAGPAALQTIPGLAGARAVALAAASDGSARIAVVAEIGCSPQSIALAVGTLATGFAGATVVAPAGASVAVAPSVAWIEGQNRWVVAWISTAGGAHVLTRSFEPTGVPLGAVVDPQLRATAASVTSTGDVFGFVASSNSFVDTSLGCTP